MKILNKIMNFFNFAPDKQLHFTYGDNIAFITICILLFFSMSLRFWEILILGFLASLGAGLFKEVWDGGTKGNKFNKIDLLTTTIGGVWAIIKILILKTIL